MRYIRTKNGVIIDLEKFINNEKDTPYYTDFIFDEITKDGHLKWTAVGTDKNSMENQRGRRCQFGATLNSEIVNQADTIEELCDGFVVENPEKDFHVLRCYKEDVFSFVEDVEIPIGIKEYDEKRDLISGEHDWTVYGAIWTSKGLIYVAKMDEKGEMKLL